MTANDSEIDCREKKIFLTCLRSGKSIQQIYFQTSLAKADFRLANTLTLYIELYLENDVSVYE